VDWHAGEYIQPRPFSATEKRTNGEISEVVAVINLRESQVIRTREVMLGICQVIAKWNIYFKYAEVGVFAKTGSCQQFVNDIFKQLNIKDHYWDHSKGRIYKLLNEVKASRDLVYYPTYNGVKIKTHEQLDATYNKYFPASRPSNIEDYEFFRALDRSYWVTGETTCNCPLLANSMSIYAENGVNEILTLKSLLNIKTTLIRCTVLLLRIIIIILHFFWN